MTVEALEHILAAHPFFYGMAESHLATLAGCASPIDFPQGQLIFREGQTADACYLIVDGDVALEIVIPGSGPHVVQTLHGGDVLGWSWLFPPYRWSFDAQALTATRAVKFDAPALRTARDEDCSLGFELMSRFAEVLADRLQAARIQLLDVYGNAD